MPHINKNTGVKESKFAIVLGCVCTPLFLASALLTLCVWHPLIALSRNLSLPERFHDWFIAAGNRILQFSFLLTGGRIKFEGLENLPAHGPVIVVANHQSLFDIPLLIWLLRRYRTKFVAKKALGRGIPSASYVLRTNGHALIDRADAVQSVDTIRRVAQAAQHNSGCVVIFPEGTRARDGNLKKFKTGGLKILLQELPLAKIVPVSINGAWRIMRFGFLPVPFGVQVGCTVHPQLEANVFEIAADNNDKNIAAECERIIRA